MRAAAPSREWVGFAVAAALVVALPLVTRSSYHLTAAIFVALNSMLALGLGLLMGQAGQVSLGHAAFYGMGAYASAITTTRYGLNPWLALLGAAVVTGSVAYAVGRPTLKLQGHYLAMATLGFGIIVRIIFNEGGDFTGGPSGITGVPSLAIGAFRLDDDLRIYCVVWPVVLLMVLLSRNLLRSRLGRGLVAIHDSEIAARSCAIDTGRCKLMVFVLAAVWASLAGSFYAHTIKFVNPEPFGFAFSIELVVMVAVGGTTSLWGPVLGAAALTLIGRLLVALGGLWSPVKDLDIVLFGIILVLVLMYQPQGIAHLLRRRERALDAD